MEPNTKDLQHLLAYVAEKGIDTEKRTVRFVISSDKIDRDNERIETSAIAAAIKDFAKNPVCLTSHMHRTADGGPPVVGSWDTDSFVAKAHTCEMNLVFATTKLADDHWQLYRDGHMRSVSIGFIPGEWHEEKTEKNGCIFVLSKLELVEISCVAVGSNREALAKKDLVNVASQFDAKAIADTIIDKLKSQITIWINASETIVQIHDDLEEIKSLLVHDHGEYARALSLDNSLDQPDPAGTASITEQKIKEMLMKAITNL